MPRRRLWHCGCPHGTEHAELDGDFLLVYGTVLVLVQSRIGTTPIRKAFAEREALWRCLGCNGGIILVQEFVYDLNCKGCPSTFVATKTSPQYLSFREDFANGGVLEHSSTHKASYFSHASQPVGAYGKWARGKEESEKGKGTKFVFRFINPSLSLECIPNLKKEC